MTRYIKSSFVRPAFAAASFALVALSLAGCSGQSDFSKQIASICAENAQTGQDCTCIAKQLDASFPDQLKPAFVALRWPLRPDPQDRDAVNGAMLRAAGIDPADPQQMKSAVRAFRDVYYPLREQLRAQCGGDL